jgi:VIT1/CCC1 family predicted Fe2+/Mn2+ transporter
LAGAVSGGEAAGRDLAELARRFCIDELTDSMIYRALAEREPDPARRRLLETLAEQEHRHYLFWRRLAGGDCGRPPRPRVSLLAVSYRLLGPVFTLRLLERGEESTIERYKRVLPLLAPGDRERLEEIIREEEEHEERLLQELRDARVKYLGYVALGLADAIVEVTGVHAGFLGATSSTIVAGVAGLIVGFSAALSMAGAAYLQAKHGGEESPGVSALVTGLSYIFSVVVLALPYFLTHAMLPAFVASTAAGLALTGAFTYYSAVVQAKAFLREYAESAGLLLATALGSYLFGEALGSITGIRIG